MRGGSKAYKLLAFFLPGGRAWGGGRQNLEGGGGQSLGAIRFSVFFNIPKNNSACDGPKIH